MSIINKRLEKLRTHMEGENLESILVIKPENRYYMSGFTGSNAFLVITKNSAKLITDFRYTEQAAAQCPDYEIVLYKRTDLNDRINEILSNEGINNLGFDETFTTYASYLNLKEHINVSIMPYSGLIEKIRLIKDENEIRSMQKAQSIAEEAFSHILTLIKPGMSELEVAIELEYKMKQLGAERISFPTIAASGKRSSLPHGRASEKIIDDGDFITFDFGAYYNGYCSDMTRTVIVGNASEKQKEIYDIVLKAQLAALKACRPGVTGKEVDKVARDIITEAGYGENFGHGLGHGVGKMVHEGPSVSPLGSTVLEPGHVITIEPGIYLPGFGGVRIEDMVLITEDGYYNFNKLSKELIII